LERLQQLGRFEDLGIVIYDLSWAPKPGKNVLLNELHDDYVSCFSCGDGFYPLGEIICGF